MTRYYTKDHEWLDVDGTTATVGITDYAQHALGDVVYVELPDISKTVTQGGDAAVVESVKAASEVYAPVSGTVTEINQELADNPALVNTKAESTAWFFKMTLTKPVELEALMNADAYKTLLDTLK